MKDFLSIYKFYLIALNNFFSSSSVLARAFARLRRILDDEFEFALCSDLAQIFIDGLTENIKYSLNQIRELDQTTKVELISNDSIMLTNNQTAIVLGVE